MLVNVQLVSMKLMKKTVPSVTTDVLNVPLMPLIVKSVLPTEKTPLVVTVHSEPITLKTKLNVQIVMTNVNIVLIPPVTVPPVPET
jgi:hypothetical protein